MNRGYRLSRRTRRNMKKLVQASLLVVSLLCGYVIGYADSLNDYETVEVIEVTPEVIEKASVLDVKDIKEDIKVTAISDEVASTENTGLTFRDVSLTAGIATVLEGMGSEYDLADASELEETVECYTESEKEINAEIIRCTGYCDYDYTKSGEWVREGIIAGKKEWLGRTCNLYRINEDKSIGELIGSYEFLDTGYGINGSLIKGTSVDVWHPNEDSIWDWMAEYGDYVYIEFTS